MSCTSGHFIVVWSVTVDRNCVVCCGRLVSAGTRTGPSSDAALAPPVTRPRGGGYGAIALSHPRAQGRSRLIEGDKNEIPRTFASRVEEVATLGQLELPAQPGFDVRPRDFTTYKFRSTETGDFPLAEDVERVVRERVPGTSMPAWGQFLNDEQIADVSAHLVSFSERFVEAARNGQEPTGLELSSPPANLDDLTDHGRDLYVTLQCAQCHGPGGLGDGPSAPELEDSWGYPMEATDLTNKWEYRNGHEPEDIYRAFVGGLNGTPMPSFADAIPDESDRWALVAYMLALSPSERPVIHLENFADERRTRITPSGRVRPAE